MHTSVTLAERLLGQPYESLDPHTLKVAQHIAEKKYISRNLAAEPKGQPRLGQRAADAVAKFGGSWAFVEIFTVTMLLWIGVNATLLWLHGSTFDPYPYILLNLFLSMLAAVQAADHFDVAKPAV